MDELGPIQLKRRGGQESFHIAGRPLGFDLLSFWQWSSSDLVSNATRGVVAEYLVAQALGVAGGVREEWAPYDVDAPGGIRVEVKSAAYIQSWDQKRLSPITFRIPKTRVWDENTNRDGGHPSRQADVYVFALLAHTEQKTLDVLDVSQWKFFVVPTMLLDSRKRSQHSIALRSLRTLAGESVGFAGLKETIGSAGDVQRKLVDDSSGGHEMA